MSADDVFPPPPARGRDLGLTALMVLVLLLGAAFVWHGLTLGLSGLTRDISATSQLQSDSTLANLGIFSHMITGALITALAPLQLVPGLRRRWPRLHRVTGRLIVGAALIAALGGLSYMALRGTVGGAPMTAAFTLYGLLVALCVVQTIRMARAGRFRAHRDWAVRLFFLCIASLLYRVHYGLWFMTTDGVAVQDDFRGAFDLFNIWAFYLPYLLIVELVLARRGRGLFAALRSRPHHEGPPS
jgi:uncharacterized membrane protein